MKASELIQELQAMIEKHGDLDVEAHYMNAHGMAVQIDLEGPARILDRRYGSFIVFDL